MKKFWVLLVSVLVAVLGAACGNQSKENTLVVGATQVPHAEILEHVKPQLEKQGVNLEIRVFTDYVLPNKALEEGEIDANYFQHIVWLQTTNQEKGYHLRDVARVHLEPMGAYSKKINSVDQLKNGAKVAIPNGTSEITRVLQLLEKNGLIKLNGHQREITLKNIVENPKNLQFELLEASALPRMINEVDLAVINTNYALQADLDPLKDALFMEEKDQNPYVNVLAVKQGNENNQAVKKLAEALTSPEVKKFIEEKYKGVVVPAF
ncbi:MetQ/NlpA family ABC transporter substrate-binding protein [Thermoactinomyces vulgaris]|uniref:MetQ/NlpA family ABC transporter substrate-binding protein n=1 Tax=Thermoactinomyces vulgaris TaxID=2026 RepID=UPI00364477BA